MINFFPPPTRAVDYLQACQRKEEQAAKNVDSVQGFTWALGKPPFPTPVQAQKISRMLTPPEDVEVVYMLKG